MDAVVSALEAEQAGEAEQPQQAPVEAVVAPLIALLAGSRAPHAVAVP